ncbi:MAG: hypothetical protein HKN43_09955 [Rhodothermales bacterium]|nr:hypothetical protein [Rhodothermales bacterium]
MTHRRSQLVVLCAFLVVTLYPALPVLGQELELDYRYPPPRWMTPIGLPGDWHKPLVDQTGALLYDFGPGPYATASTRISVDVEGDTLISRSQTIDNPRVPIIATKSVFGQTRTVSEALSVLPDHDWIHEGDSYSGDAYRSNGINGSSAWANAPKPVDPAFQSVAYGTNRPIYYRLRVPPGSKRTVVLGFTDPYRIKGHHVTRIMDLSVEGAAVQTLDVVNQAGQNQPVAISFAGIDANENGWIEIRIDANISTIDGNIFVSGIWVFEPDMDIDQDALIRGELTGIAEMHVDCGRDQQLLTRRSRVDLMRVRMQADSAKANLVIRVQTRRDLKTDSDGRLHFGKVPFVESIPPPDHIRQTEAGWELRFPENTRDIVVRVTTEGLIEDSRTEPDFDEERLRVKDYWLGTATIPFNKITIPDSSMQALFEGSIRTMYQLAERVDGVLQTQPGPSVYRGLWVSNQPRVGRALTHLGDYETPRSSFEATFSHQEDDGQILVLTPPTLLKETGIAVHSIYLHARMTRDKEFLEAYWPKLVAAADWLIESRKRTTDSTALNFGLMPSGTSDGGVGGIIPEYTTVYWSLQALKNMADGAAWLDRQQESLRFDGEFASFMSAFRKAARRDLKRDQDGNWFLPIRMEFDSEKHVPQRSQTQFSHIVYPGRLFSKDDPIVTGNMAMLAAAPRDEGLTLSTGWLDGGVQPFIQNTEASARLYLGQAERVQQELYAIANHAAPTHVWIEEQRPGTGRRRSTGDVPHSSASAEFVNLIRYMVAMEDDRGLELLKGIPHTWIFPGALLILDDVPTEFGNLTLSLVVAEDGRSANLNVSAVSGEGSSGGVTVYLSSLKQHGFRLPGGVELPDMWGTEWGHELSIEMIR